MSVLNPSPLTAISLFTGLLADPKTGALKAGEYRRYQSTLASHADFGTHTDASVRAILYQVGLAGTKAGILAPPGDNVRRLDAGYAVPASLADDFNGFARKYTNFAAHFGSASLAGIVDRLARTLALSSHYEIRGNDIRGGRPLSVVSVPSLPAPVSASTSHVFIPRLVDHAQAPDTFAALVSAVIGEGGTVATDAVDIDANVRAAIVPDINGDCVSPACVDALRLLGANMAACEMGGLFAYAFTRGIHRALSVVSHTDEGGIVRDCLRSAEFAVPYGGIHFGLQQYAGLPALGTTTDEGVAGYVDAIAIGTAALVAH